HFLATCLLVPALRAGAPSRVVSVSSRGHQVSPVVFEDIQFARRPYDKWQSYGQAKTANILFAVGLDRRLGSHGVHALALHPGLVRTELTRHLAADDYAFLAGRTAGVKPRRWRRAPRRRCSPRPPRSWRDAARSTSRTATSPR